MVTVAAQETGVILWVNAQQSVAVIWCADQQRLAYYAAAEASVPTDLVIAAGDLVAFTSRMARGLRLADAVRVLEQGWHPQLAQALREKSSSEGHPRRRATHLRAV